MPKELIALKPGKPIIREYKEELPTKGYIQVKVEFGSPKHGTESTFYHGNRGAKFPMGLGNMCVGKVIKIGEQVEDFSIGERVAGYGSLRETHTWLAKNVLKMNKRMSWKEAVCFDPAQFALAGIRDGHVRLGDKVAVFGLGAIGQMAVQMARMAGVTFIAAIDPIKIRREITLKSGADITFDPTSQDVGKELKERTNKVGIDVAIETSANYRALNQALQGLAYGGNVAYVGWAKECKGGLDLGEFAHFRVPNIVFARVCSEPNRDYPRWNFARIKNTCWRLLSEGNLRCEKIIQPVIPFSESTEAYKEYIEQHPEKSVKLGIRF